MTTRKTPRLLTQSPIPTRSQPPVPDRAYLERDNLRLQAEKAEWANMASIARLDRDRLQSELKSAIRERDVLAAELAGLRGVADAAQKLVRSPLASTMSGGAMGRLREAVRLSGRAV